jgi:putative selenium metabolism protein SsnA
MSRLILTGPTIVTNNGENMLIKSGAVLLSDGRIEMVGEANDIRRVNPDVTEENLGPGLLTPGLVNLHHHLYSSFARGWNPPGNPPENLPGILESIWWKLDSALELEDILYSALVGLCESVLAGVTSVVDHHSSQRAITGSLDMIAAAFDKTGLSGSICFELSDRAGKEAFEKGLKETKSALDRWRFGANGSRLTAMVGMHASMTLSDRSLKKIAEETKASEAGYHFHLAEDQSDQERSMANYGLRATERFARFNLLNSKSLAVHGVHLDHKEINHLWVSGTNLVLCPRSNQNNAIGFPSWWDYKGIDIGLGTDGIDSDMLQEARAALYLSRHVSKKPDLGIDLMGKMLLSNNHNIFERLTGMQTGKIAPGYPADMVLWRYNPPTPLDDRNIWGHYLYGLSTLRADSVWADGKRILKEGAFVDFDYDEILSRARVLAKSLWERI